MLMDGLNKLQLDLSELPRDKVSGQASAEIHLSRPYNPKYGYIIRMIKVFLCLAHAASTDS